MNLLVDESVDRQIVDVLRHDGHQVLFVAEMEPGIPDDIVLERANQALAILLTADKDFGELVYRQKRVSHGTVLIRLAGLRPERKAEIAAGVIRQYGDQLKGAFAVITANAVRIRRDVI